MTSWSAFARSLRKSACPTRLQLPTTCCLRSQRRMAACCSESAPYPAGAFLPLPAPPPPANRRSSALNSHTSHPNSLARVKSYEGKLATLTAINSALQSENGDLRRRLDEAAEPSTATGVCGCAGDGQPAAPGSSQQQTTAPAAAMHARLQVRSPRHTMLPCCLCLQRRRCRSFRRNLGGAWARQTAP